jgi:Leucine-rich repeat (LRR) protein
MNIYIKYNLDQEVQKVNSFNKIPNYNQIVYLYCRNNQLNSLPNLPNSLQILWCSNNQLSSLPNLPNSLQYLYCEINQLSSLPNLPNSLKYLYCNFNQLSSLPNLPNSLIYLNNPLLNNQEIEEINHKYLERNFQLIIYSINPDKEVFLDNIFYDLDFKNCSRCQNFFLLKEKYQWNQKFGRVPVENRKCSGCNLS